GLQEVLAGREQEALAEIAAGAQGGGKSRGRHHAAISGGAGGGLFEVDRVRLADGLGEPADAAFLDFVDGGLRLPSNRVAVHSAAPHLPAGRSRTVMSPGSAPATSGTAWATDHAVARSPGTPPGMTHLSPGSPTSSISSRGSGAPRAMVNSRWATSF